MARHGSRAGIYPSTERMRSVLGFTLIELLVVIAITGILSSAVIISGSSGRRHIAVSTEASKMFQFIARAKSRAVLIEFDAAVPVCGYGVRIDYAAQTYAMFRYKSLAPNDCDAIASISEAAYEELERVTIPSNIKIEKKAGAEFDDVLFVPPDPTTIIWHEGVKVRGGRTITITSSEGSAAKSLTVTTAGQISL